MRMEDTRFSKVSQNHDTHRNENTKGEGVTEILGGDVENYLQTEADLSFPSLFYSESLLTDRRRRSPVLEEQARFRCHGL